MGDELTSSSTPVEIDTALSELFTDAMRATQNLTSIENSLNSLAGNKKKYLYARGEPVEWEMSFDEVLQQGPRQSYQKETWAKHILRRDEELTKLGEITAEQSKLEGLWKEKGGWSRFFIVNNAGGHIHSSMNCSTCYPTTQFGWLPQLSGQTEKEAVDEHGGILCSICFPSAPTAWTEGVSKKEEAEKEARAAERQAKKEAKLVKALTPDGTPLRLPQSRDSLKTQRSAEIWLSDSYDDFYGKNDVRHSDDRELVFDALQKKTGKTRDELMKETQKRVKARRKRDGRA